MSTVYIIKDGIIVDTLIATSSYRSEKGTTVKPVTKEDEEALILFSDINKRIKEVKEEISELKKEKEAVRMEVAEEYTEKIEQMFCELLEMKSEIYLPGKVSALMEQWKKDSSVLSLHEVPEAYAAQAGMMLQKGKALKRELYEKELEYRVAQAVMIEEIKAMHDNFDKLDEMMFQIETTDGVEQYEAEINLHTRGKLEQSRKQLNALIKRVGTNTLKQMDKDREFLERIKHTIKTLPEEANHTFMAQLWREEQIQNTAETLEENGWEIIDFSQGDGLYDDSCLLIQNAVQCKAMIRFTIEGEVEIDSFFEEDELGTRTKLQQLVVTALKNGGAVKAKGKCMDEETENNQTYKNFDAAETRESEKQRIYIKQRRFDQIRTGD